MGDGLQYSSAKSALPGETKMKQFLMTYAPCPPNKIELLILSTTSNCAAKTYRSICRQYLELADLADDATGNFMPIFFHEHTAVCYIYIIRYFLGSD